MPRVVLAMSGGVDSSVAAHLLLRQGHEVIGVFMRHGEQSPVAACNVHAATGGSRRSIANEFDSANPLDPPGGRQGEGKEDTGVISNAFSSVPGERADHKQGCCSASDAEDARRVADNLGVPFYALNLQAEFGRIIDYFVGEYISGRTPNPCVICNQWLKFGRLFDYADSVGAELLATGHYARVLASPASGEPQLRCGVDRSKDQSYALFGIQREVLRRVLLPVGEFDKSQIRAIAEEIGLRVADKRDSQEICFVTSGRHDEFIRERLGDDVDRSGEFVTTEGRVVGRHNGIERFTVGQRKGLGIALGEPYFVVRIEAATNRVVLGRKDELACHQLTAARANWLVDEPAGPVRCQAKIRYNARPADATVEPLPDRRLQVTFDAPSHGVAPGQAVVCYDGDIVLGGGWIESTNQSSTQGPSEQQVHEGH